MTSQQSIEQPSASPRDTLLLVIAVALMVGGVVAFYYFAAQMNVALRTLMVLGGIAAGAALAYQTAMGRLMWSYVRGTSVELRKTTWPTRQEGLQATLMIAVVVLLTALLMWGLDSVLLAGVKAITGRG
jgi:preprotein translocase subunit SecE